MVLLPTQGFVLKNKDVLLLPFPVYFCPFFLVEELTGPLSMAY